MKNESNVEVSWIRELMKGKSDQEIAEAEERFGRYLQLVKRIAQRLEQQEVEGICHVEDHREGRNETNCEICLRPEKLKK